MLGVTVSNLANSCDCFSNSAFHKSMLPCLNCMYIKNALTNMLMSVNVVPASVSFSMRSHLDDMGFSYARGQPWQRVTNVI